MSELIIAMAQINPTVGDIEGNVALIVAAHEEAARMGAHLVVLPEMAVTGYPLEDLVLKRALARQAATALQRLAETTAPTAVRR